MAETRVYTSEEAATKLTRELPEWYLDNGTIARRYATNGWPTTMMLVNSIAFIAEAAAHHPDLMVSYASVQINLTTHDAGGISDKDFATAHQIEAAAMWRPAADSPLAPGVSADWIRSGDKPA